MTTAPNDILTPADPQPKKGFCEYVHSSNFPDLLKQLKLSLVVTTYQAQRVLVFSPGTNDKLSMLMRVFERPTGLAVNGGTLALCAKNKIWIFGHAGEIRNREGGILPYDVCYAPRMAYVTGDIEGHEMAFVNGTLHVVNTRFSCICTLSEKFSFTERWRPRFVTETTPDDRCHLNGLAVDHSGIRYVSALGETNAPRAWSENKAAGGVLIDYRSGETMARGLSMPHSPRLYDGRLWILNSGRGELQVVDQNTGTHETVARLPGFLRGLAFHGSLAFVGVCKIREKAIFGQLPIESMFPELESAIYAIDIRSGALVGFIRFNRGIEELFDIQVIPGATAPHMIGFEEATVDGLFVLP